MKAEINSTAVKPCNIIVFASGNGTNAERLIHHFKDAETGSVTLVMTNNPHAGVIQRAENTQTPYRVLGNQTVKDGKKMIA